MPLGLCWYSGLHTLWEFKASSQYAVSASLKSDAIRGAWGTMIQKCQTVDSVGLI